MKIIRKEPGKDYQIIDTSIESQYDFRSELNGRPEFVYVDHDLKFIVDEDGLLKDLPINFCIMTTSQSYPIVKLMGTVLMIRTEPVYKFGEHQDNRVVDLRQEDIEWFEQTLAMSEYLPIPYYDGYES